MSISERVRNMPTHFFMAFVFCMCMGGIWTGITVSYVMNPEGTTEALKPELTKLNKATEYVVGLLK